jgi:hypothetical protein
MKYKLKERFRKNGLLYRLVKRNEVVALIGVGGTFTDEILHYEVCRIHIRNDQYGIRESLPSNEQFGRNGSLAIIDFDEALRYFEELTSSLESSIEALNNDKSGIEEIDVDSDVSSEGLSPPL